MEFLFGKKLSVDEQVKKWKSNLRTEERNLDKQLRSIEQEEQKIIKTIKQTAKNPSNILACKSLAKNLVASRKAKDKIYSAKAQLNSVSMQLQQQASTSKIVGHLAKSTQVMKSMNQLVKLPQISKAMRDLSIEMIKGGLIEEMVTETLEGLDPDDVEEEAQAQVDKILDEIIGQINQAPIGKNAIKATSEKDQEFEDLEARLEILKS